MLIHLLTSLLWGTCCGLIGAVYIGVLAYEHPFSLWWKFGNRFEGKWFFRPLWECEKCFAGQLALWSYLIHAVKIDVAARAGRMPAVSAALQGYSLAGHAAAVCAGILSAMLFARVINGGPARRGTVNAILYTAGAALAAGGALMMDQGVAGMAAGFMAFGSGLLIIVFTAIV